MPHLRDHVKRVRLLMDMVEEVIVVDSESTDGTAEYLQKELAGPKLRFFNHPPGLYESWNFGIARARARFVYVSTVGDGVDRNGLAHLIDVAEQEKADVVVSPPRFIHAARRKPRKYEWPIHWLIENAGISAPRQISAMQAFLVTLLFNPSGILGSSASNLYRTETIQRYPFPANFGRQGDTAWALENALRVRWALSPSVMSDFVVHGYPEGEGGRQMNDLRSRLFELAVGTRESLESGALSTKGKPPGSDLYLDLKAVMRKLIPLEEDLTRLREGLFPWCLLPAVWLVRRRRNLLRLHLREIACRIAAMEPDIDSNESANWAAS